MIRFIYSSFAGLKNKSMTSLRYNFFHQIHQGLRALLYQASLTVQQTDFKNSIASAETKKTLNELLLLFDSHAHTEDTLVFPMIQEHAPELVADFEQQHEIDSRLGEQLRNTIEQHDAAVSDVEKLVAGKAIQGALAGFTAFNLNHMLKEETEVAEVIWRHYSDEVLHNKTAEIVANLTPEKNMRYSFWMLKGLGTHEIIEWFREIQAAAPPFVFDQMKALAKTAMPAEQFTIVEEALQ